MMPRHPGRSPSRRSTCAATQTNPGGAPSTISIATFWPPGFVGVAAHVDRRDGDRPRCPGIMDENAHAQNKFGHFIDNPGESVVGAEFPRKIVGAVAAGLQVGGGGLLGERPGVDYLESGLCEMIAQALADHRAPFVLGFLFARRARHDVAMLEFEFEDRDLVGGMRSARNDSRG